MIKKEIIKEDFESRIQMILFKLWMMFCFYPHDYRNFNWFTWHYKVCKHKLNDWIIKLVTKYNQLKSKQFDFWDDHF